MQVNSLHTNLHGMVQAQSQMDNLAKDVVDATSPANDPLQPQELTPDLLKAITEQIPTQIGYEANAKGIQTQDAVQESLLNIKA